MAEVVRPEQVEAGGPESPSHNELNGRPSSAKAASSRGDRVDRATVALSWTAAAIASRLRMFN